MLYAVETVAFVGGDLPESPNPGDRVLSFVAGNTGLLEWDGETWTSLSIEGGDLVFNADTERGARRYHYDGTEWRPYGRPWLYEVEAFSDLDDIAPDPQIADRAWITGDGQEYIYDGSAWRVRGAWRNFSDIPTDTPQTGDLVFTTVHGETVGLYFDGSVWLRFTHMDPSEESP